MSMFKSCLEEISLSGLEGKKRYLYAGNESTAWLLVINGSSHHAAGHNCIIYLYSGCTLEELWRHLSDRQPLIAFKMDIFTKQYIWKEVLASVTDTVDTCPVLLYRLPSPRELIQTTFYPCTTSNAKIVSTRMEYKHPFPYRFVSLPSSPSSRPVTRGSCASFFQRQDVTMEIASEEMSLSDTEAKWVSLGSLIRGPHSSALMHIICIEHNTVGN